MIFFIPSKFSVSTLPTRKNVVHPNDTYKIACLICTDVLISSFVANRKDNEKYFPKSNKGFRWQNSVNTVNVVGNIFRYLVVASSMRKFSNVEYEKCVCRFVPYVHCARASCRRPTFTFFLRHFRTFFSFISEARKT